MSPLGRSPLFSCAMPSPLLQQNFSLIFLPKSFGFYLESFLFLESFGVLYMASLEIYGLQILKPNIASFTCLLLFESLSIYLECFFSAYIKQARFLFFKRNMPVVYFKQAFSPFSTRVYFS